MKAEYIQMGSAKIEAITLNEIRSNPGLSNREIDNLINLSLKIQKDSTALNDKIILAVELEDIEVANLADFLEYLTDFNTYTPADFILKNLSEMLNAYTQENRGDISAKTRSYTAIVELLQRISYCHNEIDTSWGKFADKINEL